MTSARVPANVRRGVELLDERLPGWRRRVRPGRLNLVSDCDCVLGHVLGSYTEGVALLGLTDTEAAKFGFWRSGRQTWTALTDGWRKVLS